MLAVNRQPTVWNEVLRYLELELGELDFNILTDRKWAYYAIEQIVNNACKYVDNYGIIKIPREGNR